MLESSLATFIVANPNSVIDTGEKNLAVADLAGASGICDCVHNLVYDFVREDEFQLYLGNQIHRVFPPTVELSVALLTSMTADFDYRHAFDSNFMERVFDGIKLGVLNNGFDLRHDLFLAEKNVRRLGLCRNLPVVAFFPMLREIKSLDFVLFGDPQSNDDINDLQNDERADSGKTPGNQDTHELV